MGLVVVGVVVVLICALVLSASSRRRRKHVSLPAKKHEGMNTVRKLRLSAGKAWDHGDDVVLVAEEDFDLESTVFRTVSSPLSRAVLQARLRLQPYWREGIEGAHRPSEAPKLHKPLLEFMRNECDFAMEHADGSFMDHLQFCSEYSAVHFKLPKVLLLHSILGVGTNFFPLSVEKIPRLREFLNDEEWVHIQAFPSVVRLILSGQKFLEDVVKTDKNHLTMHRVIDNRKMTLTMDEVWTHLNFQLIHLLDFLPLNDWKRAIDSDVFLAPFSRLHRILTENNQLQTTLDYDATPAASGGTKIADVTLGSLVADYMPASIQLKVGARQVKRFSREVGHDLSYTFHD